MPADSVVSAGREAVPGYPVLGELALGKKAGDTRTAAGCQPLRAAIGRGISVPISKLNRAKRKK